MSNRLFSATGAVWHCGPKRVKRTWLSTLVCVLMLLALSALAGWLMSLVRHGAGMDISHSVTSGGMMLAVAPWQAGSVIGLLAFGLLAGIWLVVTRSRRAGDIEAELKWSVVEPGALQPLPPDDLRRILWSVTECVCVTCDNVRKARLNLRVEDYGEKLEAAEADLHRVIKCLNDLMKHLNAAAAEGGGKA